MLTVGTIYTSGSLLHQRQVLAIEGDKLTYRVISSHCEAVIGSIHEYYVKDFSAWARAARTPERKGGGA